MSRMNHEDLLFAVLAVQTKLVDPAKYSSVLNERGNAVGIREQLLAADALTPQQAEILGGLVQEALAANDGDITAVLAAFGGDAILQAMGRNDAGATPAVYTLPMQDSALPKSGPREQLSITEQPGRYKVLREHARGGMGRILLVQDSVLGREVAMKELLPQVEPEYAAASPRLPVAVNRFLEEARITGQLEHPSIVPIHELARHADGTPYYVMKLVRGATLASAIRERPDTKDRLRLLPHFYAACQAVAYAHSRGVINRDIKPDNIMAGEFGETVVLDWGIAKRKGSKDIHADSVAKSIEAIQRGEDEIVEGTAAGTALGTPVYMAPEQARGELDAIDERTDVYALGATLYELLCGHAPFPASSLALALSAVIKREPEPVERVARGVPPELAAICRRAMQKHPAQRYASVKELAEDIERYLGGARVGAYRYGPLEHAARFVARHRATSLTAVAALLALLAGAAYFNLELMRERNSADNAAAMERSERRRADAARKDAEEARAVAERAGKDAEAARLQAEQRAYDATIRTAGREVEDGAFGAAEASLWRAPEPYRQWEWGHLLHRFNEEHLRLAGHSSFVNNAYFVLGGARIATASDDHTARIWDAGTGAQLHLLPHQFSLNPLAINKDGTAILTNAFGWLRVWDVADGRLLASPRGTFEDCAGGRFAGDGKSLFWWSQSKRGPIGRFSAEDGANIAEFAPNPSGVRDIALSASDTVLAAALRNGDMILWDVASQTPIAQWPANVGKPARVYFVAGDTELVGIGTEGVKRWKRDSGKQIWEFPLDSKGEQLYIDPEETVGITLCRDGSARAIDLNTGAARFEFPRFKGVEDITDPAVDRNACRAAFHPTLPIVACAMYDRSIQFYDTRNWRLAGEVHGHDGRVRHLAFDTAGKRLVSTADDVTPRVWDVARILAAAPFDVGQPINRLAFNGEGGLIGAGTGSGMFLLRDTASGALAFRGGVLNGGRSCLAFRPGTNEAACGVRADANVMVWNYTVPQPPRMLAGHRGFVTCVNYSRDGKLLVSGAWSGEIIVWDAATVKTLHALDGHNAEVIDAAFDPSGERVVSTSYDGTARIWNLAAHDAPLIINSPSQAFLAAAFTPDGASVVTSGADRMLRGWDAKSGKQIREFSGHTEPITGLAISPDGQRLASVSKDKTVRIWSLESGAALLSMTLPSDLTTVAFSPDGRTLGAGCADKTLRLFQSAPWRLDAYPGQGDDWHGRFRAYQAARPEVPPAADVANVQYVTSHARLRRVLRDFLLAGTNPDAEQEVQSDLNLVLRADSPIEWNGRATKDKQELAARIEETLASLENETAPQILTAKSVRGGQARELTWHIQPRTVRDIELPLNGGANAALVSLVLPALDQYSNAIREHVYKNMPLEYDTPAGAEFASFVIPEFGATDAATSFVVNAVRKLMATIGLTEFDMIREVGGVPATSIEAAKTIMKNGLASVQRKDKEILMVVDRGLFTRLRIHLKIE